MRDDRSERASGMTLKEMLSKRRQEIVDFFSWRFGTTRWNKPLMFTTGVTNHGCHVIRRTPFWYERRSKSFLSIQQLLRMEMAALKLGFRPGVFLDLSKPPRGLP